MPRQARPVGTLHLGFGRLQPDEDSVAKDKQTAGERPASRPEGAARSAERRPVPAPQFIGETVVFHCPRGHRLVVSVRHAGKQGKCDKKGCGAPVTVPTPPAGADAPPGGEPAGDVELLEAVIPVDAPIAELPLAVEEEPALPAAEAAELEPLPDAPPPAAILVGGPPTDVAAAVPSTGWDFIGGEVAEAPTPAGAEAAEPSMPASGAWSEEGTEAEAFDNPTARLVARLWVERDNGGIVELHLVGGSVILPEWYDARWSRGTHGLFASQATDGTVTLTAVAWDAIQKVVVRQVQYIPDGMFE